MVGGYGHSTLTTQAFAAYSLWCVVPFQCCTIAGNTAARDKKLRPCPETSHCLEIPFLALVVLFVPVAWSMILGISSLIAQECCIPQRFHAVTVLGPGGGGGGGGGGVI